MAASSLCSLPASPKMCLPVSAVAFVLPISPQLQFFTKLPSAHMFNLLFSLLNSAMVVLRRPSLVWGRLSVFLSLLISATQRRVFLVNIFSLALSSSRVPQFLRGSFSSYMNLEKIFPCSWAVRNWETFLLPISPKILPLSEAVVFTDRNFNPSIQLNEVGGWVDDELGEEELFSAIRLLRHWVRWSGRVSY